MNIALKIIDWYLFVPNEPRSFLEIIKWWELRRIAYNLLIGSVGFVGLIFFFIFAEATHKIPPGEDLVEPIAILFAPIFINICYTAGEVLELVFGRVWKYRIKNEPTATSLLKFGTLLSLILVLFPSVSWGISLLLLRLKITD